MNKLSNEKRVTILSCLVEGMGVKAAARVADVSHVTVLKFIVDMGEACGAYMDKIMRNLTCKRVQVDELWSFVYAKQKNATTAEKVIDHAGDVWTWVAIDADTKLVPCYMVGARDAEHANEFIADLKSRLANRVQLTSDGHKPYLEAVESAFGSQIDYAMLIKMYGEAPEGARRYSPAHFVSAERKTIEGAPDAKHVSTSFVERQNLSVRMANSRFTRLTNKYSKKLENHEHGLAIYYMAYNFVKIHSSLRVTPAMEAGIAKKPWTLEDVVGLLND